MQGPNLAAAVIAAARLGVKLEFNVALPLLRHADPSVRAAACACVRAGGDIAATLIQLLTDLIGEVATAAACALGSMGRVEALGLLKRCLIEKPSPRVIEALAGVSDEKHRLLARLAKRPELSKCVLAAPSRRSPKGAVAALGCEAGFPIPIDFIGRSRRIGPQSSLASADGDTLPVAVFSIVMGRFRESIPRCSESRWRRLARPIWSVRGSSPDCRRSSGALRKPECIRAFGRRIAVTTFQGVERSRPFQFGPSLRDRAP